MNQSKPKILIYGFGPYERYLSNITSSIVSALKAEREVVSLVFAVRFDKKMFSDVLDRVNPDFIIGLGQHPRARAVRIERRIRNWMIPHRTPPGRPIERRAPAQSLVSLILPKTTGTTVTYDAGTYVCNYSMWYTNKWAVRHGAHSAFLHIPRQANVAVVVRYLRKLVKALAAASGPTNEGDSRGHRLDRRFVLKFARTRR